MHYKDTNGDSFLHICMYRQKTNLLVNLELSNSFSTFSLQYVDFWKRSRFSFNTSSIINFFHVTNSTCFKHSIAASIYSPLSLYLHFFPIIRIILLTHRPPSILSILSNQKSLPVLITSLIDFPFFPNLKCYVTSSYSSPWSNIHTRAPAPALSYLICRIVLRQIGALALQDICSPLKESFACFLLFRSFPPIPSNFT